MTPRSPQQILEDETWMAQALQWAERGRGWTSPRPSVGCVLVSQGRIIGAGHTQPGNGQPHAEVMALRNAGLENGVAAPPDTCAYVTLEPCSHWGTTPPCCDALLRAGIKRVVVGINDPNPLVSGRGLERLSAGGVQVTHSVLLEQCRRTHEEFLKTIVTGRPFVTLKSAVSLDGRIALSNGASRWITGKPARERAHRMRHINDAVLVGIGTVLTDDPSLSVRLDAHAKQPARIVVDPKGRLPLNAHIWDGAPQVIVVAGAGLEPEKEKQLKDRGARLIKVPARSGGLDWNSLLAQLYEHGIHSVLLEGGARTAASALRAGVVDKVCYFVAPALMGEGQSSLEGLELASMADVLRLRAVWHEVLGNDVLISGYLGSVPGEVPGT